MHGADAGNQQLWRDVLEQEPARPGPQGCVDVFVHVERRQHHHPRLAGGVRQEPSGGGDAVGSRHPHVHQNHVRPECCHLGDSLVSVDRLADHVEVRLDLQDHAEPDPDQGLVVDDQNPDRGCWWLRRAAHAGISGSVATSSKPPSGRTPAIIEPP